MTKGIRTNLAYLGALVCALLVVGYLNARGHPENNALLNPPRPPLSEPKQNPSLFPCASGGKEHSIKFSGQVVLDEKLLPRGTLSTSEQTSAIREQLKFLSGFFDNEVEPTRGHVYLSSRPGEISIRQLEKTTYLSDLRIDSVPHPGASPYLERAIAVGHTSSSDSAYRILYDVEFHVASCTTGSLQDVLSKVKLPLDPYLAYWYVPAAERVRLKYAGKTAQTNPCASLEIAALNFSTYYWFVWHPDAKGVDLDQKHFACAELLRPNREVGTFDLIANPIPSKGVFAFGEPLIKDRRELKGTIFFGLIDPWGLKFSPRDLFQALNDRTHSLREKINSILEKQRTSNQVMDSGVRGFLFFLDNLSQIADIKASRATLGRDHVVINIRSQLKASRRSVDFKLYVGNTDANGSQNPGHWPFFLESLAGDDFTIYLGHSGLGANLSLDRVKKELKVDAENLARRMNRGDYHLFAFLTCNAYTYFGEDILKIRAQAPKDHRTDMVLMATTDFKYNPMLLLGIFDYLDHLGTPKKSSLVDSFGPYVTEHDEMWFSSI